MQKLRILVVDDEVDAREDTVALFKKRDCVVFEANSGEQALDILRRENLDAVILDVIMYYMGGIECLQKIRQIYKNLPVFMYTDYTNELFFKQAEQYNATGYFVRKDLTAELPIIIGIIQAYKGYVTRIDPEDL